MVSSTGVEEQAFICTACGIQYEPSARHPDHCIICSEERQYIPVSGQNWTTLPKLQRSHMATFRNDHGLLGVGMSPNFAIGQRALLVRTPAGNVLWDCISLISDELVELIDGIGGLRAIAISHPHYYTTMVEWSRAFGGIPVYIHANDRQWAPRADPNLKFWEGDVLDMGDGLTLLRVGGHFEGSAVLHHRSGADGKGALLTGDTLQVVPDRRHLGFMRSYPHLIPLSANAVRDIADKLSPYRFDAIYGAFWDRVIPEDGEESLRRSVERHVTWVSSV